MKKTPIFLALLLAGLMIPIYLLNIAPRTDYTDFDVYHRAGLRLSQGQFTEIYNFADGASPFRYAPPSLFLFRMFADLTLQQAKIAWFFVQYFSFVAGFWLLWVGLRYTRRTSPATLALAFLFIVRFVWDTFMIGQVSSLMFAGFCFSLAAWTVGRPVASGLGLFVPAFFKIGPGINYLLLGKRSLAVSATLFLGLVGVTYLILPAETALLWQGWANVVVNDSTYFDASHYANQSLKGVLLRLTSSYGSNLHLILSIFMCASIVLFWILRKPRSLEGRALFFCLGLFAYLWCMPETFKYTMTLLAIPIALLLGAHRKSNWDLLGLGSALLFLSLPAKDFTPDWLFFGIQKASLPFVAMIFLAIAIFRRAWFESIPSRRWRLFADAVRPEKLGPWENLPPAASVKTTFLVPLPLDSFTPLHPHLVRKTLDEWCVTMSPAEVLIIPYGNRKSALHPVMTALKGFHCKWVEATHEDGRGAALRKGFLQSRGERIVVVSVDQPCGPSFVAEAFQKLDQGTDLVRANRRGAATRFRIPVRLLSRVHGRHRMGVRFNRLVRLLLPVQSKDTQSGTFAVSRSLALHAFAVQSSADFLADLELSLSAAALGLKESDVPVVVYLLEEKSSRRVLKETLMILRGLPLLALRYHRGCYGRAPSAGAITADDWGISPGVNRGILELAKLGVIKRVSMMADCAHLRAGLVELMSISGMELGLHFNLTYGAGRKSPRDLLSHWLRHRSILMPEVRKELETQLKTLEDSGVQVKYVDGHHHIHLLPGLIDGTADIIRAHGISQVRLPYDPSLWLTPKFPLLVLSLLARGSLTRNRFKHLPCFYPKHAHFRDHGMMRAKLAKNVGSEVIVHPADADDVRFLPIPDSYSADRVIEYRALKMLAVGGSNG